MQNTNTINSVDVEGRINNIQRTVEPGGRLRVWFDLQTSYTFKTLSGDQKTNVQLIPVCAWGNLASIIEQNFDDGDWIYVRGWLKRNGKFTDVVVLRVYASALAVKNYVKEQKKESEPKRVYGGAGRHFEDWNDCI